MLDMEGRLGSHGMRALDWEYSPGNPALHGSLSAHCEHLSLKLGGDAARKRTLSDTTASGKYFAF